MLLVNHDVVIYNFRLELVERLIEEGYEVHISAPTGTHTEELKALGTRFHEISFDRHAMNPLQEVKLLGIYRRLMKEIRPLIVFTYTVKCNVYGSMAAKSLHIPFCVNITGLGSTMNNGGSTKEAIVLFLYKIALKGAQRIFFQNEDNKAFMLKRRVIRSPHTVLPGSGVNLDRYRYVPYPEKESPLIISYTGRIMRDKGIDELLQAARIICKSHPEVEFRLIGFFDDDYKAVIRRAKKEGIVQYFEHQPEVQTWIAESHAILMPSHHEGMSNAILEGASTGRPVIASDIPGCREAVEDGVSGFLFRAGDSKDLIRAIREFMSLDREEKAAMGRAGRRKMEQGFSRTIVVNRYMKEVKKAEGLSSRKRNVRHQRILGF